MTGITSIRVTCGSEGVEDVGELAADRAGADDHDRLRRLLEDERLVGRDDGRLVQLEADLRQTADAGTGRDDDGFLRVVLLVLAVDRLDRDDVLAGKRSGPLDPRDLVLLEEELDALGVLQATARDRFIATP